MIQHRHIPTLIIACLIVLNLNQAPLSRATSPDGRPIHVVLEPSEDSAVASSGEYAYLSPITATTPFTHMLLRWEAAMPEQSGVVLEVQTSLDGITWMPWEAIPEETDLQQPNDDPNTHWGTTLYAGAGMTFWQVRASVTPGPYGNLPSLHRIEVNTVDARFGPATPSDAPSLATVGKPTVVSRSAWGNPDGQSSRATPIYRSVTHLVIHHTADANTLVGNEKNWADRVRAEWSFHTFTRGWGDIGYNYVIDPNGVIYEGRAGGDNVVGFHDTANYGSMGVAVLGTYTNVAPSQAAQNSLIELLAWKAEQQKIDPLGSASYYGCTRSSYCAPYNPGGVVATIAGHREITPGHTSCPGDSFQARIPNLRTQIEARMAGMPQPEAPDNGDLTIDNLEAGFVRSDANWYGAACGYNGHSLYTYATSGASDDEPSTNWATWSAKLPTSGRYRIFVRIPNDCDVGTLTNSAHYIVHADSDYVVTLNQQSSEEWVSLGVFNFSADQSMAVSLSDITGEPFSAERVIFFDSIMWVAEPEPEAPSYTIYIPLIAQ